ncbi:DUF2946 family protein [Ochrobactrum sp. S1502_03]|uniref:DUF2946 family protein n=1 Tax=Ochrobactrum sp. S1502_03 TaxID=3108451 RepID=UPI0037C97F2B
MKRRKHHLSAYVAFMAACVLFLQSFFAAYASAGVASQPILDAFGNPLCITSSSTDPDGKEPVHSKLPNCCTFGCSSVSPLLPAPDIGQIVALTARFDDAAVSFHQTRFFGHPTTRDPGRPRAPPQIDI